MKDRNFEEQQARIAPQGLDQRDRVIWVIHECVGTWRKYSYLQDRSGIRARRWQNVCHRVQQPSIDMLAVLAEVRPYFLSWMVAGHALGQGQVNPESETWHVDVLELPRIQLENAELKKLLAEAILEREKLLKQLR